MLLQKLRPTHIEQYYASRRTLADTSLMVHHAILPQALRKATKDRLIATNPAADFNRVVAELRNAYQVWKSRRTGVK
jgi:hypothetical protein